MLFQSNREVFPYVVVLKKKYQRSGELLSILSALIFVLILVAELFSKPGGRWVLLAVILSVSGMMAYNIRQYRQRKKPELMLVLIVMLLSWYFLPMLAGVAFALLANTVYLFTTAEEIGFSEERIHFKSPFRKDIKWQELNNAMIKDGLLTLDFKNNKLFQAETDDDEENDEYDVSEEEFNAFCREQLAPLSH